MPPLIHPIPPSVAPIASSATSAFPVPVEEAQRRLSQALQALTSCSDAPPNVEHLEQLLRPDLHGRLDPRLPLTHPQANGNTPLMLALQHEWFEMVDGWLPESDLRAQNAQGQTAAMLAMYVQKPDLAVLDRLFERSDLLQVDEQDHDAVWHACRATFINRRTHAPLIEGLLKHWPRPLDAVDPKSGFHALHIAILHGLPEVVQVIRDAVPDSDWLRRFTKNQTWEFTPLMLALLHNQCDSAERLLPGSDVIQTNSQGRSAWSQALKQTNVDDAIIDAMALHVSTEMALEALRERGPSAMPRFFQRYEADQLRRTLDETLSNTLPTTLPTSGRSRL